MNVSSYIYGTSFYHKFDVRPKLISTLLFSVIAFIMSSWTGFALVFLMPLVIMVLSVGAKETWRCYSRLIPIFILLILFIPLQKRSGLPILSVGGFVVMTEEGLWMAELDLNLLRH